MNEERNRVLILEEANLKIKNLVNNAMLYAWDKYSTREEARIIIQKYMDELTEIEEDKKFLYEAEQSLKKAFLRYYTLMVSTLQKKAKNDNVGLVKQTLALMQEPVTEMTKDTGGMMVMDSGNNIVLEGQEITNLREMMTVYDDGGAGRYTDYVGDIQKAIIEVEDEIAKGTLTTTDTLGRTKSVRNMAEIKTRYELIQNDLEKLEKRGVKYVVATAHANCSERCQHWQGKTFLVDIDIASRDMYGYNETKARQRCKPIDKSLWVDGRETYSLKDAIECGFLSYNCQHRVVAYAKGVVAPTYPASQVEKQRRVSAGQREIERQIRAIKAKQAMHNGSKKKVMHTPITYSVANGKITKTEGTPIEVSYSKHLQMLSKEKQEYYALYCEFNNVARYDWRTKITETERTFTDILKA